MGMSPKDGSAGPVPDIVAVEPAPCRDGPNLERPVQLGAKDA